MPDVQVSNARRVGFTAMALVVFWMVAWRVYLLGSGEIYTIWMQDLGNYLATEWGTPGQWIFAIVRDGCIASLALFPTVVLSLSLHNRVLNWRDPWIVISGVLLGAGLLLSFHCGRADGLWNYAAVFSKYPELYGSSEPVLISSTDDAAFFALMWQIYTVSWCRFLAPIIVTTAFVIYGAWRRAVRGVEAPRLS